MEELLLLLWFALWLVGPCVLQLGVLRLTRRRLRFLRLLPLAAVGWPLVCALRAYRAGGLFVGLNVAAALLMWWLGTGGILIAIYLLPFGCMALGMALGKRHGLCPLFPLACALCLLPIARGLYHMAGALCLEPAVFALLGNAAGAYPRKDSGT